MHRQQQSQRSSRHAAQHQQDSSRSYPANQDQSAQGLHPSSLIGSSATFVSYQTTPSAAVEALQQGLGDLEMDQKKSKLSRQLGKVSRDVTRRRRNFKIKQIIRPKNAITAIQELAMSVKADVKFSEPEPRGRPDEPFRVSLQVFGKFYIGSGRSIALARLDAAENALRDTIVNKVPNLVGASSAPDAGGDVDMLDGTEPQKKAPGPGQQEDETAWGTVAAYAMHKLLADYGIDLNLVTPVRAPAKHSNGIPIQQIPPPGRPALAPAKKMPSDPSSIHPVTLIGMMRPQARYTEATGVGTINVNLSLIIDNLTFVGIGVNKKAAKRNAAEKAVEALLGVKYNN